MTVEVGNPIPEFSLESHLGDRIALSNYQGNCNVVLAFFPLAWTPV